MTKPIDGVDPRTTSVGFITAVSAPFCGTCNRIRLTCHGRLHTCLFDEAGLDLLASLRDDRPGFTRHATMAAIGG